MHTVGPVYDRPSRSKSGRTIVYCPVARVRDIACDEGL
jgi:hypothetical protein